jgi:tryptophan halogenase
VGEERGRHRKRHYRYNTRLDTPFWRHCREHTDLAGAEQIVEFYQENGPTRLWEQTVLDHEDQFGVGGYYTLLVGQKVPFRRTREPTEAEISIMNARRRRNREVARQALTVRAALDLIHSPQWEWDRIRLTAPESYVFNLK